MESKNIRRNYAIIVVLLLVIGISIGYAALSATLNINGQTTINKASWDIHMEDINVTSGSVTATTVPTLDTAKATVNFSVKLTNPGDFYEFTVKEVNKGTIDAMVSTISKTGLTTVQAKYLDYIVTYSDGTALAEKQLLKSNQSETLKIRVAFKKDITAADLPTVDTTLNLNLSLSYQQADDSAVAIVHPTCKRATVLHTEVCNQTDSILYCSGSGYKTGDVITYGNLGTTGTLTSGDAFDCDVNGDGVFDSETERFYYVSGKDGDNSSNYATLIYYSNVSGGVPDNTKLYAYNTNYSDYLGPQTAIKQLPTTTQWKNVKLSNTTRNITDEKGTVRVNNFSYSGYAVRLLTTQEVNKACGITVGSSKTGELETCKYLMENTAYSTNSNATYGSWLETVKSSSASSAWNVSVNNRFGSNDYVANASRSGVRPAIEVLKSKISS